MKRFFGLFAVAALCIASNSTTYVNPAGAITLDPGGACVYLYGSSSNVGENPASGTFSQQVYIPTTQTQPTANLSFTFYWTSNPGAFNYQIQDADVDITGNYVTIPMAGTVTSAPQAVGSGNYVARVELNPFRGRYARIYVNTQTANSVNGFVVVCR